jgi:hypothetical protein
LSSGNWQFLISNDFEEEHRGGNQVDALNHPFSPSPLGNDLFAQFGDAFALPLVGNFDPPVNPSAQTPTSTALGPLLGGKSMDGESVSGEKWYSFQALRSGTVSVSAAGGDVHLNLFSESYALMPNAAPAAAGEAMVTSAVTAGQTYMVRLSGAAASLDLELENAIDQIDRLDTSRDARVTPRDALMIINDLLAHGSHQTPMEAGNPRLYLDTNLDGNTTPSDALQVINYLLARSAQASAAPAAAPLSAPAAQPAAAAADPTQAAVATGLAMSASPQIAIEPAAVDVAFSSPSAAGFEHAAASMAPSAIDAAWSAGDDWLSEDEADEDGEADQ